MFLSFVLEIASSIFLNESRKYFMSSLLVLAGFGPPASQCSGGVVPNVWSANAKLEHVTCLICAANVRTFSNAPDRGLTLHALSGIASANVVMSRSAGFQMQFID